MKYVVMMIDIKHSKRLDNLERSNYQMKLYEIIKYANELFVLSLKEKITFSGGDSIQGLFNNVANALKCYFFINNAFYPYELRCGIGYGGINEYIVANKEKYKLTDVDSNFFDGDSYHMALEALNNCKQFEFEVILKSNSSSNDLIINQLLHSNMIFESLMSKKQEEIFFVFNLLSPILNIENSKLDLYKLFVNQCLYKNMKEYKINENILNNELSIYFDNQSKLKQFKTDGSVLFMDPFSKSLNEDVAKLIDVSRENVRQMVEKGKYNEIRKSQIIVISYINKIYMEEML